MNDSNSPPMPSLSVRACLCVLIAVTTAFWLNGCGKDDAAADVGANATATAAIMTLQAALAAPTRADAATETPTPAADTPIPASEDPSGTSTAIHQLALTVAAVAVTAAHATAAAQATETAQAVPIVTATPTPADTPQGDVTGVVNADPLNVRAGPGTEFELIEALAEGDVVRVFGRSADDAWLAIRTDVGRDGWVKAEFIDLGAPLITLSLAASPPTPSACAISVAAELKPFYDRTDLGCPVAGARPTWAAFQPFERGFLIWREDTDEVYLFLYNGVWQPLLDRWPEGASYPGRGDAPAGLQSPVRGFGYLWATSDWVFDALGWAVDKEKGFCLAVQDFDAGVVLRSLGGGRCPNGQYNFAAEPGFGLSGLRAMGSGYWVR